MKQHNSRALELLLPVNGSAPFAISSELQLQVAGAMYKPSFRIGPQNDLRQTVGFNFLPPYRLSASDWFSAD
eukprot:5858746-Pyramimonas_sp.AAC.2